MYSQDAVWVALVLESQGAAGHAHASNPMELGDMSSIALNNCRASTLVRTHHLSQVLRTELRRKFGGIDKVAEQDSELATFRFGSMRGSGWRCDVCGLGVWRFL